MKKITLILTLLVIIFLPYIVNAYQTGKIIGYIFLQVEKNGEAWYIYPTNGKSYYLGRPTDAFKIMKELALGAKHDFIINTDVFPERLLGMILLDVEQNGEAYYIYPGNQRKYYLGRPTDAFKIMRELGRGITNSDLANITVGIIGEPITPFQIKNKILINGVPFTTQAPYGEWTDQRQQDGCEESSALMAIKWARKQNLTQDEALKEITGISDWLLTKYGEYRDISAQDMVDWIFKDYFKYDNIKLVKNITINNIIEELNKGNLIITPMNGQVMHNPYFTPPGPIRHAIVIRGYDPETKKFITNDPGTKRGELYSYDTAVLYEAIRDYPTGYHEIIAKIEKNMIVIEKEK